MSVKHERAIIAALTAAGPMLPSVLDLATDLEPGQRVAALAKLHDRGEVECVRPERGPVTWRLPTQTPPTGADEIGLLQSPQVPGTAAPETVATGDAKREELDMTAARQGIWTNRPTGGAVLAFTADLDGAQSWDVTVEGAAHPIPVIAAFESQADEVVRANGMTPLSIVPAKRAHLSGASAAAAPSATPAQTEEKTVTDQIKDGLAASESKDEIDAVLDAAAKGEGTKADAREVKPDPKPSKAKADPRKRAVASQRKAKADKPATRAEQTRKAQAARRTTPKDAAADKPAADPKPKVDATAARAQKAEERKALMEKVTEAAVAAWNDPKLKVADAKPSSRRHAVKEVIAKQFKMKFDGKVMSILRDGGVDARQPFQSEEAPKA